MPNPAQERGGTLTRGEALRRVPDRGRISRTQSRISSDRTRMRPVSACALSDTISVQTLAGGSPRSAASAGVLVA